jgi:hypothetical protein
MFDLSVPNDISFVGQLAKLRADCQSARAAVGNRRAG